MNIKKPIIAISSIGLLATATPMSSITTNQATFADLQNVKIQSLDVGDKLTEMESINKSYEKVVSFKTWKVSYVFQNYDEYISNIESRVKLEDDDGVGAKEGKIERDDLFSYERTDTQYTSYHRYKSNNVEKNNHTSWCNAKKYQLIITVPPKVEEYKVQVVADVKIKNCLEGCGWWDYADSFAQAKLSQLSIYPQEVLMSYMGIKDNEKYLYNEPNHFCILKQNDLFGLFANTAPWEWKPYIDGRLSSVITLSNETGRAIEIPIYFWYGFMGGGYDGGGPGSHINCSEVTFSANHIE